MEGKLPHDAKRIAIWLPNRGRPRLVVSSPAIWNPQNFFTASGREEVGVARIENFKTLLL
jgi:hypothetical protein